MKARFLIYFLCLGSILLAQDDPEIFEENSEEIAAPKFSLGIDFQVGVPLNDFWDNLNQVAFGVGGSFLVRTNPSSDIPVMMGLSGSVATYDSESQDQLILIDGATIDARLTTRNNILLGHAVIRVLPPVSLKIQPYFDGMIGFKNLFTRTTLEDQDVFEGDDTIESYIEQGDWAFSFGGALGIQILIGGHESFFILLDGRCTYLKGSAADYLVRNADPNVQIIDTIDAFEEKNSTTDMLIPQIGVSFVF